jgi:tetratricopeptide (TPR) repeat protein
VTTRQATLDAGRADPQPRLHRALLLNDRALACYESGQEPRVAWEQRADLARLLGRADEARRLTQRAAQQPGTTWTDRYLLASQSAEQKEHRKALSLLQDLTSEAPDSFVAWFGRGVCHLELLQDPEAVGCFSICIALRPDCHWAWYHRGLAASRLGRFHEARSDFDRVVALQPNYAPGYMNRAAARHELNDYSGEIADLTRALDLGGPPTTILVRRSAAHRAAGELAAADQDLELAARTDPNDEDGLIDRGLARAATDPEGARAEFDAAGRMNTQSLRRHQGRASLLGDKQRQNPVK